MPRASPAVPFSTVEGIEWPALASPAGATMLAMQWQLERSQWWPAGKLLEQQFRQLRELVAHAIAHAPYYRSHLSRAGLASVDELTPEAFLRWPLLSKRDVQQNEAALAASQYPQEHGPVVQANTTGSTGVPTRVRHSMAMGFFVHALALRDHLWHERDFTAKLAAIRGRIASGGADDWWGVVTNAVFRTGPSASKNGLTDVGEQLDWLLAERPAYLVTSPSNLRALLRRSRETGKVPAGVREVVTFTEHLPPELRTDLQRVWRARLVDVYSSEELGPIALQCPSHEHYHVQAENLYVELLRGDATPCRPGELGRVVVTALHNFPMPLLRYDLGDYAEAGEPCPCGRGLPVLRRIVGRVRNMARDPNGRHFRPAIAFGGWLEIAPIRKLQLVQHTLTDIEMRYEMERDLSPRECERLAELLRESFGYPFRFAFIRVPHIERKPGEKYEEFISLLEQ
jgi:phenylacetate-CoA ligase